MKKAQKFFGINYPVNQYPGNGRHKECRDPHGGEDCSELRKRPVFSDRAIGTNSNKPRTPYKKLHKAHKYQAELDIHKGLGLSPLSRRIDLGFKWGIVWAMISGLKYTEDFFKILSKLNPKSIPGKRMKYQIRKTSAYSVHRVSWQPFHRILLPGPPVIWF